MLQRVPPLSPRVKSDGGGALTVLQMEGGVDGVGTLSFSNVIQTGVDTAVFEIWNRTLTA